MLREAPAIAKPWRAGVPISSAAKNSAVRPRLAASHIALLSARHRLQSPVTLGGEHQTNQRTQTNARAPVTLRIGIVTMLSCLIANTARHCSLPSRAPSRTCSRPSAGQLLPACWLNGRNTCCLHGLHPVALSIVAGNIGLQRGAYRYASPAAGRKGCWVLGATGAVAPIWGIWQRASVTAEPKGPLRRVGLAAAAVLALPRVGVIPFHAMPCATGGKEGKDARYEARRGETTDADGLWKQAQAAAVSRCRRAMARYGSYGSHAGTSVTGMEVRLAHAGTPAA